MNINKSKILSRIKNFKKKSIFKKKKIKFKNVDNWKFDHSIIHSSKKFFKIYGYSIKSNFPNKDSSLNSIFKSIGIDPNSSFRSTDL